jgi:hypothetical protein
VLAAFVFASWSGSGAVWLTRWTSAAGDPSLRLKNGSAQDDTDTKILRFGLKLHHYRGCSVFDLAFRLRSTIQNRTPAIAITPATE